jgi:hypothetical protein
MFPGQVIITTIANTILAYTVLEIPGDYTQCNSDVACVKGASEYLSMSRHFQCLLLPSSKLLFGFSTSYNVVSQCHPNLDTL